MRAIKKGIAALLCAAMVITLAPAGNAGAAKKPKLNKKNVSVGVGETVKIKVKNAKKKAKVTWKTSKKAVAKITKKVSKGKKASATVMGVKVGKAKITAVYKLGKSKKKLNCTVTVHSTSIQQPQASAGAVVLPSNAPVVSGTPGTPEASTPPVVEGTPTARPKRSPTPEPTPTPTPLPDQEDNFEKPSNGIPIDVAAFNCTAGNGKYDPEKKRVEVNDNDPSGGSMGNWKLPDNIANDIKDGDIVTFRVQGYNYGDSGFRFWIGNEISGGCTPVMLVDQVAEGLGIDSELGYPCVKDDDGKVLEGQKGEDIQSKPQLNQMAIGADPQTKAFDVTFKFKAGTSQNDTNSAYTHFVLKHIMSGGTAGYINGLVIKNIYYITDKEIPPTPTMDPDQKGIDLSGTKAVYGDGSVSYDEASGSVTGTSVQGLLIPLEETLAEGESRKVTVYGEATGKVRLWLSDNDTHRLSDIVDPMTWANTYTLTATATGDGGTASNAIQIKVPYSDPATHVDITVTKVVVEAVGDEPTPSKAPEATPSAKPDPTPSKEPEPTPSEEVTPSEGPTPTEEVGPTQTPTDEPAPSEGPQLHESLKGIDFGTAKYVINDDGSVTITGEGKGADIVVPVPETLFTKVVVTYSDYTKEGMGYGLKFKKKSDNTDMFDMSKDVFEEGKTEISKTITAEEYEDVKEMRMFDLNSKSVVTIKSIEFINETAEPSEEPPASKDVDIQDESNYKKMGADTVVTNNEDGSITLTSTEGSDGLMVKLPDGMQLKSGDSIKVHLEVADLEGTSTDARVYLIPGENDTAKSNQLHSNEEGVIDDVLTATDNVDHIFIKVASYGQKFNKLTVKKLTVTPIESGSTEEPVNVKLDLNTIQITDGSTKEVQEDGSVVITCNGNYTGGITIAIPAELQEGAKRIVIEIDAEKDGEKVGGGQLVCEFDGAENDTKYNWNKDNYDDTVFDVTGKKPTKLIINNQDAGTKFTIKKIEIQK